MDKLQSETGAQLVYLLVLTALAVAARGRVRPPRADCRAARAHAAHVGRACAKDAAQTLLDGMTTREKICQLLDRTPGGAHRTAAPSRP
ncbi:MAG: hypothetical protein ACLUNO_08940 [Oscillospiraceae bacterium]